MFIIMFYYVLKGKKSYYFTVVCSRLYQNVSFSVNTLKTYQVFRVLDCIIMFHRVSSCSEIWTLKPLKIYSTAVLFQSPNRKELNWNCDSKNKIDRSFEIIWKIWMGRYYCVSGIQRLLVINVWHNLWLIDVTWVGPTCMLPNLQ